MAKQKANPAPKTNGKLGRRAAATKVVVEFEGRSTLAELTAAADALVVAAGGKANPKATGWYVRRALESAQAFGLLRISKPTDVLVEKVGG